jgi:hypothetical protein
LVFLEDDGMLRLFDPLQPSHNVVQPALKGRFVCESGIVLALFGTQTLELARCFVKFFLKSRRQRLIDDIEQRPRISTEFHDLALTKKPQWKAVKHLLRERRAKWVAFLLLDKSRTIGFPRDAKALASVNIVYVHFGFDEESALLVRSNVLGRLQESFKVIL